MRFGPSPVPLPSQCFGRHGQHPLEEHVVWYSSADAQSTATMQAPVAAADPRARACTHSSSLCVASCVRTRNRPRRQIVMRSEASLPLRHRDSRPAGAELSMRVHRSAMQLSDRSCTRVHSLVITASPTPRQWNGAGTRAFEWSSPALLERRKQAVIAAADRDEVRGLAAAPPSQRFGRHGQRPLETTLSGTRPLTRNRPRRRKRPLQIVMRRGLVAATPSSRCIALHEQARHEVLRSTMQLS